MQHPHAISVTIFHHLVKVVFAWFILHGFIFSLFLLYSLEVNHCACPPLKTEGTSFQASSPWRCALCTSTEFFLGKFTLPLTDCVQSFSLSTWSDMFSLHLPVQPAAESNLFNESVSSVGSSMISLLHSKSFVEHLCFFGGLPFW